MDKLKHQIEAIKGQINRFITYLDSFDSHKNYNELKMRRAKLDTCLDEFNEVQTEIELITKTIDDTERTNFEKIFFETCARADDLLEQCNKKNSLNSQPEVKYFTDLNTQVKLPPINLPTFSGMYEEWNDFFDLFQSLIHNNANLATIQKFHYLKSALRGDALQIIQSIETTEENYKVALDLLKNRFENKRLISLSHVKALFEISSLQKETFPGLRQFLDTFQRHVRALKAMNHTEENLFDMILISLLSSKLDKTTHREWEKKALEKDGLSTYEEFREFLQHRCNLLESLHRSSNNQTTQQSQFSSHKNTQVKANSANTKVQNSFVATQANHKSKAVDQCTICKKPHKFFGCEKFLNMSINDRISEAKKLHLCLNCLGYNHTYNQCQIGPCKKCSKKHNTLLHLENFEPHTTNTQTSFEKEGSKNSNQGTQVTQTNTSQVVQDVLHTNNLSSQVLLTTALVNVFNAQGKGITCRVLLDSGSQSNFITAETCDLLNLKPVQDNMTIRGVNNSVSHISGSVSVKISSRVTSYETCIKCFVLPKITENLPIVNVRMSNFPIPSDIRLADPDFATSSKIDILIGAEVFFDLLCPNKITSHKNYPILQNTKFGWVVSGKITNNLAHKSNISACNLSINEILSNQIKNFWELEEVTTKPIMSNEEANCESHFQNNFSRNLDGRFCVRLPFKENLHLLGSSKDTAEKRLLNLEKRFLRDPSFKLQYTNFMNEYINLNHMSLLNNDDNTGFYIPHHAVLRKDSLTTKLRVVFDASAQTSSGVTLNDTLMKGPIIQRELFEIIMSFRFHTIVITADIEKMFRQVEIHQDDRNYQKILWRENSDTPIQTYTLNTVTYGTTTAPFLSVRCLIQLASEYQSEFPTAAEAIRSDFYVDDLLTGAQTVEDASRLHAEITQILNSGCLNLRKWRSNHPEIFHNIPESTENYVMPYDKLEGSKTLGLIWDSNNDQFKYSINQNPNNIFTKRSVLSSIAQIFDPLGFLGPVVTLAKLVMQRLWQLHLEWDESLPPDEHKQWSTLQGQLVNLNNITVPRPVTTFSKYIHISLHGFCDASQKAYGACIYVRTTDSYGNVTVRLLCSKARVAPLKTISLPRLELCAAQLLSQLITKVIHSLKVHVDNCYLWTDSTIVLCWIASPPSTWKTFIANRVADIQAHTSKYIWQHVKTTDNPADAISRGLYPEQLLTYSLWWNGPQWLHHKQEEWPIAVTSAIAEENLEKRKNVNVSAHVIPQGNDIFLKYSSVTSLIRITAYILRFKKNCLKQKCRSGILSTEELREALMCLIKLVQGQVFFNDIESLQKNGVVHKKSNLLTLSPFLDNTGILRVGGRLRRATMSYDQKHPVILPSSHKFTELLITKEHLSLLHSGTQATLAAVRLKFWPLSGRSTVKKVIRRCITCFRHKPTSNYPMMGDLPEKRITPSRPFLNTGIDYAGPITIKESHRRGRVNTYACYVAVFVCLSTKATHLELVSSLSTEAFISALKRFTARRGKCANIFSDNAGNFVKANKTLKNTMTLLSSENHWNAIETYAANEGITWHFIPARSPTFGGIWEASVKSFKHHMKRITGNLVFTYEEYQTFLVQVEACLNSRPLIPLSNDPNDLTALTPAHFIIGDSLHAIPEPNFANEVISPIKRWNHIQLLLQHFWRRWSSEYLGCLQGRGKWKLNKANVQVGQLVLLKDENLPPLKWKLGRITELFPGEDKIVRVVHVKTVSGCVKRAVNKLCVLPLEQDSE